MGSADCITAVISDTQQYNMHNMHIKTQLHKHICIPIYKHTINKREPKANTMPTTNFTKLCFVQNELDQFNMQNIFRIISKIKANIDINFGGNTTATQWK